MTIRGFLAGLLSLPTLAVFPKLDKKAITQAEPSSVPQSDANGNAFVNCSAGTTGGDPWPHLVFSADGKYKGAFKTMHEAFQVVEPRDYIYCGAPRNAP